MKAANYMLNGTSMIHVGGFTPWNFKYVDDQHGGILCTFFTIFSSFSIIYFYFILCLFV
jgi:hypothetical protein